jgi:ABC-type dipeptide/oligopeptide/nickel transport system ATPase component
VPNPANPPSGCRFRTRCWKFAEVLSESQQQACLEQDPELVRHNDVANHRAACHYAAEREVLRG